MLLARSSRLATRPPPRLDGDELSTRSALCVRGTTSDRRRLTSPLLTPANWSTAPVLELSVDTPLPATDDSALSAVRRRFCRFLATADALIGAPARTALPDDDAPMREPDGKLESDLDPEPESRAPPPARPRPRPMREPDGEPESEPEPEPEPDLEGEPAPIREPDLDDEPEPMREPDGEEPTEVLALALLNAFTAVEEELSEVGSLVEAVAETAGESSGEGGGAPTSCCAAANSALQSASVCLASRLKKKKKKKTPTTPRNMNITSGNRKINPHEQRKSERKETNKHTQWTTEEKSHHTGSRARSGTMLEKNKQTHNHPYLWRSHL
jgi:hypothetical protein